MTEKRDLDVFGDGKLQSVTRYDQLGRVTRVNTNDGPTLTPSNANDGIKVRIDHKTVSGGQMTISSTPFRQETGPTVEWTCVQQDSIGRTKAIGVFKGSARPASCTATANRTGLTEFSYDRNMTRITEKAPDGDVVRDETRDALGRLTEVTEDPGAGNLAYNTAYTYDPLDNLLTVTQDIQTRTFVYSSLSRLRSATNPESGTTHYCYDAAGNLTSRTDARVTLPSSALDTAGRHLNCPANAAHTTATYVYDDLQRLDTVTYSDTTPNVDYDYHTSADGSVAPNIGRLKSIVSDAAEAIYKSYDALGRVTSMSQTIAGHPDTFSFAATYYLNDALESQTYPSGRRVDYNLDDASRVEDVSDKTTTSDDTTTYADMSATAGHAYAPDGRLQQMQLGNGLWETRDYRTPGTTTRFKLVTPDEMTMLPGAIERVALGYNYTGTANNGNLTSHTITRPGRTQPWTQTFTYDAANRLETARETGGYDREFGYDRYGNRWVKPHPVKPNNGMTQTDIHEPKYATQFAAAKNQLASPPMVDYYDDAGNQTMYSPYTLAYDAENRLKSMTHTTSGSGTYLYDGEGRRVKKTWTPGGGTAEDTYYVYDIVGNLAAEYGTGTAPPSGTVYPFTDMLGSVRAVTDAAAAVIECYDYLPFGRMLSASDNGRMDAGCHPPRPDASLDSEVSQKFTGQVRDEETRLDYFGARYMSAPQGRFLSADPYMPSAEHYDPQTWNRYTYTRNNPLRYVDPAGLDWIDLNDAQRRLFATYAARFDDKNDEDVYALLDEAQMATFEAVSHALANTVLVGANGNVLGTALDQIESIEAIAGEISSVGGDRQFRLFGTLRPSAIETFEEAVGFEGSSNRSFLGIQFYHKGFPESFRQVRKAGVRGWQAGLQPSYNGGTLRVDIDVDYRSGFGHLGASNSDVRAPGNFQKHIDRWPGLRNWWD